MINNKIKAHQSYSGHNFAHKIYFQKRLISDTGIENENGQEKYKVQVEDKSNTYIYI